MDATDLIRRVTPTDPVPLEAVQLLVLLAVVGFVVLTPYVWSLVRLLVTLVHELGHALVGVLCGRRFTGFVVNGDMSGHAVTVGPAKGAGRVVTTWAGYPAPAVVGAAVIVAAGRGWAAPVLALALPVLLVALVRARSALTAVVTVSLLAAVGSAWWWRSDPLQARLLVGVGLVLLVGAWRHLAAVLGDRSRTSDPAVLARLTGIPRLLWNLSFLVVLALSTWWAWSALRIV